MPYYKDINNEIHFLESPDFIDLLPKSCINISSIDADKILIDNKTKKQDILDKQPNASKFIQDIKFNIGGIVEANNLARSYPLYFSAIQTEQWGDVEELTLDAKITKIINPVQYDGIKNAAIANNIPINLI